MGILNRPTVGAPIQRKCSECGKILGPLDKIHSCGPKDWCDACFKRLKAAAQNSPGCDETSFLEMLDTIKRCFGVAQVPKKLLYQIDRLIENDPRKNYKSIAYTINYAFVRMGVLDPEGGVSGIIGYFYEDAAKYYAKERLVLAHNLQFNPTESTKTVKIKASPKDDPVFKPKTDINQL